MPQKFTPHEVSVTDQRTGEIRTLYKSFPDGTTWQRFVAVDGASFPGKEICGEWNPTDFDAALQWCLGKDE